MNDPRVSIPFPIYLLLSLSINVNEGPVDRNCPCVGVVHSDRGKWNVAFRASGRAHIPLFFVPIGMCETYVNKRYGYGEIPIGMRFTYGGPLVDNRDLLVLKLRK